MHTYEFTFKCERCAKELTEIVTSPDVLAKEELNQMEFHLTCPNASCRWSRTRTGAHAEKIKAALKPMSGCGGGGGMVGSGVGAPGGMEFRKAINGKFTNNPLPATQLPQSFARGW